MVSLVSSLFFDEIFKSLAPAKLIPEQPFSIRLSFSKLSRKFGCYYKTVKTTPGGLKYHLIY